MGDVAFSLFTLRPGIDRAQFEAFSAELDQPALLDQDVVERVEVYAVERSTGDGLRIDAVELLEVTDWAEWERVRDSSTDFAPVVERFAELIDPDTVIILRGPRIAQGA